MTAPRGIDHRSQKPRTKINGGLIGQAGQKSSVPGGRVWADTRKEEGNKTDAFTTSICRKRCRALEGQSTQGRQRRGPIHGARMWSAAAKKKKKASRHKFATMEEFRSVNSRTGTLDRESLQFGETVLVMAFQANVSTRTGAILCGPRFRKANKILLAARH